MIKEFKKEFQKLDKDELKKIINGCAGKDILETNFTDNINVSNYDTLYNIVYVNNEEYGFWVIEWNFKKFKSNFFNSNYGYFDFSQKVYK